MLRRIVARLLLVSVALPYVLLNVAAAEASTYGSVNQFSVSGTYNDYVGTNDPGVGGWTVTCNGTAAYVSERVGHLAVYGKIKCGVDVHQWDDPNPGELEDGVSTITFKGAVEGTTTACTMNTPAITGDILATQSFVTVNSPTRCQPTQVCVTTFARDPGTLARYDSYGLETTCGEISLGPLPRPPGDKCPYGDVRQSNIIAVPGNGSYGGYYGHKVTISLTNVPPGNEYYQQDTPYRAWGYSVREFSGGQPVMSGSGWSGGSTNVANGSFWNMPNDWSTSDIGAGNLYTTAGAPERGIWIWIRAFTQAAGQSPGNGTYSDPQTPIPPLSKAHKDYAAVGPANGWGANDPANCHFYIGPKFWNDEGSKLDDPYGTVSTPIETEETTEPPEEELEPEPPVPPPGSSCDFSFTDPLTWATGGICELVRAMARLIDAVIGLAATIADLMKAALKALFIPDKDSWKVEELRDQLETKPPFSVAYELSNESVELASTYNSSTSCGFGDFGNGFAIDCSQVEGTNRPLYGLAQFAIVSLTMLGMFYRVSSVFRQGQ